MARLVNYARRVVQNFVDRAPPLINKVGRGGQQNFRHEFQHSRPVAQPTKFSHVYQKFARKSMASELRRKYVPAGLAGSIFRAGLRPITAFGFVGVALAGTDTGWHRRTTEQEDICNIIQDIFKRHDSSLETESQLSDGARPAKVEDFDFGNIIGKGCNAVVHEAKLNRTLDESDEDGVLDLPPVEFSVEEDIAENEDSFVVLDDGFLVDGRDSEDSFIVLDDSDDLPEKDDVKPKTSDDENGFLDDDCDDSFIILNDTSNDSIVPTELSSNESTNHSFYGDEGQLSDKKEAPDFRPSGNFDLAVKIIFNYEAESCWNDIVASFEKEALPVRAIDSRLEEMWHNRHRCKMKRLPPHPNIVAMPMMFVDDVPLLNGAESEYPLALPVKLNPDGYGRNQTMFLVMKKYDYTLREYLANHDLDYEQSTFLFAQLLEGLLHLHKHRVAHRDLKSNNVLIHRQKDEAELVICDFGSCLSEGRLKIPYNSSEVSKGGNAALMAPEIAKAEPGPKSFLDYDKADVWAAGTLAYEIYGLPNPIYRKLSNKTCKTTDLPDLPDTVPEIVKKVINLMLQPEPEQRVSPLQAVNMLQIILWGPDSWRKPGAEPPTRTEILSWLMILAADAIMSRLRSSGCIVKNSVGYQLKQLFLMRADIVDITEAVYLLQDED
ncbi:serine/threonine-protein kinase Pink1, mitochondrial-like [Tubulanus polymorphus]|uniref:serine/threonine-protein kinase Pink1, mitochondrial-like n=1 Tax=Tubulanus polymorphus TaxID=672921 RepID=UPI003DA4288E